MKYPEYAISSKNDWISLMHAKASSKKLPDIYYSCNKILISLLKIYVKNVIISIPRCSFSIFCDVLYRTKKFGNPKEWINMKCFDFYNEYAIKVNNILGQFTEVMPGKTILLNSAFAVKLNILQYIVMVSLNSNRVGHLLKKYNIDKTGFNADLMIAWQWPNEIQPTNKIKNRITRVQLHQALLFGSNDDANSAIKNIRISCKNQ